MGVFLLQWMEWSDRWAVRHVLQKVSKKTHDNKILVIALVHLFLITSGQLTFSSNKDCFSDFTLVMNYPIECLQQ